MKQQRKNRIRFLILLGLLSLVSVVSLQFQCNKFGCVESVYSFELGIKAFPHKDSVNVGDTIWLEVNEPTTLKDAITGAMIDYGKTANLGSFISFDKLIDSVPKWLDAVKDFNFHLIKGVDITIAHFELGHEYRFVEENNKYIFLLAIIPKQKGIYSILFSNAANVYRTNDNCTKAYFTLNFKNTNQHYYLTPFFTGGPIPIGGDYYFKVN